MIFIFANSDPNKDKIVNKIRFVCMCTPMLLGVHIWTHFVILLVTKYEHHYSNEQRDKPIKVTLVVDSSMKTKNQFFQS